MTTQDEKMIQDKNQSKFISTRLKEVHHKGYCTYEGVPDIEYMYKGEKLVGKISGLNKHNFYIQLCDYPNYRMAANRGSYDIEQWEKIDFINKTCSGLSEAGLERAIECMKKIYDMYHDPQTGVFRDFRKTLLDAGARLIREFEDTHADEYAELFLHENKRLWQFHVNKRIERERKIRGNKVTESARVDESLTEIDKACHKLGEKCRSHVLGAFENYALEALQIDKPYNYVRADEICSEHFSVLSILLYSDVIERHLQPHICSLQAKQFDCTSKVNAEFEPRITCLNSEKLMYRHQLRLHKIENKEYMKRLAQLKCQRAKIEEQKVEKVRSLLYQYAKTQLNLDGIYLEGYIYHLTPYPDVK